MASSSDTPDVIEKIQQSTTEEGQKEENIDFSKDVRDPLNAASEPVELKDMSVSKAVQDNGSSIVSSTTPQNTSKLQEGQQGNTSGVPDTKSAADANAISTVDQPDITNTTRMSADESAIGPATERPMGNVKSNPSSGLQLVITLLLHSTDSRHPYIITESYLKRRNIQVENNDPANLTVYNLKDLIWRDWRNDWEARPASPVSIRLIHMGRMLDDKAHLKDSRFSTGDSPHVVHMSVKPQEVADDEDGKMTKGNTREGEEGGVGRSPRCRCSVM